MQILLVGYLRTQERGIMGDRVVANYFYIIFNNMYIFLIAHMLAFLLNY